mmetsp:Transcript_57801/g.65955  ORF Transcript_57801/g.65955 Transcript_57801/m.65955 type:complete len:168 (+) Transcript_57801:404-907(+)
MGKPKQAVHFYEEAIKTNPDDLDLHVDKGVALDSLERYYEALSSFEEALKLDPTDSNAFAWKGEILLSLGRISEATAIFEQVLSSDPKNMQAYKGKGLCLQEKGRYYEALHCYDTALTHGRTCDILYSRGVVLLELRRKSEAIECLNQSLEINPDYEPALEALLKTL